MNLRGYRLATKITWMDGCVVNANKMGMVKEHGRIQNCSWTEKML